VVRRHGLAGLFTATLLALFAILGCGRDAARPAAEVVSKYDTGPRAIEAPADPALAEAGARLFATRSCMACHVQGVGLSSPDLAGVSTRRTAEWLEQFILRPEVMVREDPIGRELMHEYTIQMPNFDLTPREARALIEYFKHQDRGRAITTAATR
jgi:mono/diheme cytochrome c family protein